MRGISSKVTGGVSIGSLVACDDNSGAKVLKVIGKEGYRGRKNRRATIGVGDIFIASVVKGNVRMRKKKVRCVLIRQRKEYRRANGMRVKFEDNAAIIITDKNEPQSSEIKGVVAKEVAERFPKIATIAKNVV